MNDHDIKEQRGHSSGPDDAKLLAAVARLWEQADAPPPDLADGVLARLAAEDLEFDLLTLVESEDALAGVRSASETGAANEQVGSWALEYAGADFKVYLRMDRIEDRTRVDGWLVPARPLIVHLRVQDRQEPLEATADEFGRFEFAAAPPGLAHLTFLEQSPAPHRPRITPPFWI